LKKIEFSGTCKIRMNQQNKGCYRDAQHQNNAINLLTIHRPLEETVGPLTTKQQLLITALEVIRIEDFISPRIGVGRPTDDRVPIARAFIAKAIYGHITTRQLLDQLQSDIRLLEEWTFSCAFAEFAATE
jgi:hypothetical protein